MSLRCAVLDDYQQVALTMADWNQLGNAVSVVSFARHFEEQSALVQAIGDRDIVVLMRERTRFDAALFDRLPHLKLLVTTGMRNAVIDMDAAKHHGVTVTGTEGSSMVTAELTWSLILALARSLVQESVSVRHRDGWQQTLGTELAGKNLGILGLGRLGSRVARYGLAFGMQVSAWSHHLSEATAQSVGVTRAVSKEQLLSISDFVSIHLVLSERTRGLIGAPELELMKPTAYLINTSRGPIVDEPALIEALRCQQIAGAALDVFDVEPLPRDHPFRDLPNVLATPHIGYVTRETYQHWYSEVVENIQAYVSGNPIRVIT